ncbi:MAG: ABC-type transport auxiliary lipoprotein family protein [Campylobacterota bacterium]|nr:ABC-type transport auxiliary lipoprotein family protein [Campylobacterota bacterium]
MKIRFLFVIVMIVFLGCSKAPALKVYSLNVPTVGAIQGSSYRSKSLKVTYPQSLREQMSQKMNFSYSNSDRGTYQNSEWSNDMSRLLQGTFIEVLDVAKLFRVVLSDTTTLKEDYRLESNIFAFEHSVRDSQSHAVISIQFALINADTGKLVKSKRFSYREATVSTDAQGYVAATNSAIKALSRDLLTWLR